MDTLPTPDSDHPAEDADIQDAKFFAAVGYISALCFVPLILKKGSKFAQFHGKQALVLFILELAASFIKVVPVLGELVSTLCFVLLGIFSLVGILKVLMGEYWEMPIVSDISSRITL